MHRIDSDAHVNNRFSNGNAATGQPGTRMDSDWANAVQEEIANAIERPGASGAATMALAKGTNNQLMPRVALAWASLYVQSATLTVLESFGFAQNGIQLFDTYIRFAFGGAAARANANYCVLAAQARHAIDHGDVGNDSSGNMLFGFYPALKTAIGFDLLGFTASVAPAIIRGGSTEYGVDLVVFDT